MIEHINQLFKDTKTIILPGLGALTITNSDTGELMFMPYLKHDDGVLSKYISSKEAISEEDAKAQIKAEVEKIIAEVGAGKKVPFGDFGQFVSELGDVAFENKEVDTPAESTIEKAEKVEPVAPIVTEVDPPAAKPVPTPSEKPKKEETPPNKEEKPVEAGKEEPAEIKVEAPKVPEIKEEVKDETPAAKKTLADEIKETEKDAPVEVPKKEEPIAAAPVIEKKVEVPSSNKTIAEEIAEAEKPKAKVPVPPTTKSEPSKKDLNILEKEEVEANQQKLEKLRKERESAKAKKKRGAGFYILMVFLLLLIGGGTYVALNYDQVKEQIPFLSSKKAPKNKSENEKEKMEELIGGNVENSDKNTTATEDDTIETVAPEVEEVLEEEVKAPPVVEVPKTTPKKQPVSSSNNQPYHIVAGVFSSSENAANLAKKISEMGYPAKTFPRGAQTVVSVQSYATQSEAQAALATTKDAAPKGWVLKWNP